MTSKLAQQDYAKIQAIRPGLPVDVQVENSQSSRFKTEFVGRYGDDALLLRLSPKTLQEVVKARTTDHNKVICRFVLDDISGEVIAFESQLIQILAKPFGLLIVSIPDEIQLHSLRASRRVATRIPVNINVTGTTKPVPAFITDLSWSGCRISVQKSRSVDIQLAAQLKISLEKQGLPNLYAEVCNVKQGSEETLFGLKFSHDEDTIGKVVDQLFIAL